MNRRVSCRCGAFSYGFLPNKGDGVIPGGEQRALLNAGASTRNKKGRGRERERERESEQVECPWNL